MADTPAKNYRLEPQTLARLDFIAEELSLKSQAEAIREAAKIAVKVIEEKKSKKSRKKGG